MSPLLLYSQIRALPNAHAHNDYKHKHPLTDAMNCGFTSFEADVFLKKGKFIVAHVSPLFKKKKTLEELYLKPLKEKAEEQKGHIYAEYNEPIILLIDIKTDADKTYTALKPLLEKYSTLLTHYKDGMVIPNAVTVIITGHKPSELIKSESDRYVFLDESLLDLEHRLNKNTAPLTSTKYSNLLNWKGKGKIPEDQKAKLIAHVQMAHAQGQKVRLWASPENEMVWKELLNCGVDLINTDNLEGLKKLLLNK